MGGDALHLGR